jgi:hypothetical protein
MINHPVTTEAVNRPAVVFFHFPGNTHTKPPATRKLVELFQNIGAGLAAVNLRHLEKATCKHTHTAERWNNLSYDSITTSGYKYTSEPTQYWLDVTAITPGIKTATKISISTRDQIATPLAGA